MQIDTGYFYFIKDSFFDFIKDSELMKNKENSNKRPCYYCFKSTKYDKIIWFIPVSTKVDTIVFGNVANTYSVFLIQNMFPVTEKYADMAITVSDLNQYIKNKVAIKLSNKLKVEIITKATKVLNLYNHGMKNIIFPDIDRILEQLLK